MPDATPDTAPPPSHATLERAAHWYALLRDGKTAARDQKDWLDWLHAHASHQTAWHYVQAIGRNFEPLRGQPDARLAVDTLSQPPLRRQSRRRALVSTAGATGCLLLGWWSWREALWPSGLLAWGADHRTRVGERRELTLEDGSHLWLNTASAINVHLSPSERTITLLQGEVFVSTAPDAVRPFRVRTEHGTARALGTRFNVRTEAAATLVSVYAHAVEMRTASSHHTRVLTAGQQARMTRTDVAEPHAAHAAHQAWTQGALVADRIRLDQVVQELRRYRHGHLGVADEVAGLTVYGNFPIQDTDRVLQMLASSLPIQIRQPMPWWTSIEARR